MPTTSATIGIDQEVKTRLDEFARYWNNHDPKGMAAIWRKDGDLINPFGRRATGRSEVERLFNDEHSAWMRNSNCSVEDLKTRTIGTNLVISEWDHYVRNVDTGDPNLTTLNVHVTCLLEKQGDNWYVVVARPVIYVKEPGKTR